MQEYMKNASKNLKIIWGVNLLLFGFFWMGFLLSWWSKTIFVDLLGIFILLPGLLSILLNGTKVTNVGLTFIGAITLSLCNWNDNKLVVLPVVIILSGFFILFGNYFKGKNKQKKL